MKKVIIVLLGSILVFIPTFIASAVETDVEESLELKVDQYVHDLNDSFIGTILIAVGDSILVNKGYGKANLSYDIPNEPDTKYMIGSLTKPFTEILVLKMIEKGILKKDATIDMYLPEYPKKNASRITIGHLLSHTSGIPHHMVAIPNYLGGIDQDFHTPKEYLSLFWENDLLHEPGERMTYTSLGYYTLAVILERVTQKSFPELLDEYIFQPLDLQNTLYFNNLTVPKKMATGYQKGLQGLVYADVEEISNCLGSNGIVSTTGDLYKFQRILDPEDNKILNEKSNQMLLDSLNPSKIGPVNDPLTVVFLGFGSSYGYRAYVERIVEKDACIVVMSNIQQDYVMTNDMFADLRTMLFNELSIPMDVSDSHVAKDNASSYTVNSKQLEKYQGFYTTGPASYIHLFMKHDRLFARFTSQQYGPMISDPDQSLELISVDDARFLVKGKWGMEYQYNFVELSDLKQYQIEIFSDNQSQGAAKPVTLTPDFNLLEYAGSYYSLELQKTYDFSLIGNSIAIPDFIQQENIVLIPLGKDVFGSEYGFVYFQRDTEGTIWGCKLENEQVIGTVFMKK